MSLSRVYGETHGSRAIGIVGGVGCFAGLDLNRKIYQHSLARTDQEQVSVYLLSAGARIADRSAFLLGRSEVNPASGILQVLRMLDEMGVAVAAIPCNTAHAAPIFDPVVGQLQAEERRIRLISMVDALADHLLAEAPRLTRLGVLATSGAVRADVYGLALQRWGVEVLYPGERRQRALQAALYDPDYGIKATGQPVSLKARTALLDALQDLRLRGAESVVLACSELPLAVRPGVLAGCPIIDATAVLARALLREVAPARLRPLNWERQGRPKTARG
ncbi:aspartate/glutamate racemase family protein [Alkalilimnicola sp. S0819]|uniref:aspartate/glutamate racemase family protein n=1 Tax=Alkalilimnicola sp. S0819 TaxID=2613922 RepID=UPI0012615957|nr:amino acid racemase [Alkalilimnicola sp. S0819]KAB7622860.1 aspartate/glutamate racemase family protein [Alkalilimnicola sp. S0819]MPQ17182.1 amino acid racemase [Alkalilimnicola sp. S0819]